MEGEGSYEATHRYHAGLAGTLRNGHVDELAKQAAQALDGPDGDELRRAEGDGRLGPHPSASGIADVEELRRQAREHVERGAVTESYRADRETVLRLLDEALATEIVCMLRYRRHHFMAQGLDAKSAADEFLLHANEEQAHADQIARRITELKGAPNLNPVGMLARSHSEYVEGKTLTDMIRENLVAERVAIDSYTSMIRYLGDEDSTTRRMLEEILAKEEEHAEDMSSLLSPR